ncbi:MAG: DUF166 family protein [Archaeoglobales archaeon]|nr:DUF166 family protein [Archaeoglobales archaeon]
MKIGVVIRKGKGRRAVELFSKFFEVQSFELPDHLPELIEDPESFLKIPEFFKPDILISYANHPDINLALLKKASEIGVKMVIFSGPNAGSQFQLKSKGEELGVRVLVEEICCATPKMDEFKEFFEKFGAPEVEVKVENGIVRDVKVIRSSFCGATYFVAEKIKGCSIADAGRAAGYYTQIFPCFAHRGLEGGIHKAARAHKRAIEKAIEKAKS